MYIHNMYVCWLIGGILKKNRVVQQTLEDTTSIAIASCVSDTRRLHCYIK